MKPTLPGFEDVVSEFGGELDFYESPPWMVDLIVPKLPRQDFGKFHLLEPAAGRGAIVKRMAHHQVFAAVTTFELHEGRAQELECEVRALQGVSRATLIGDFLALTEPSARHTDLFIPGLRALSVFNPPYSMPRETIGLEFVVRVNELLEPLGGFGAALLPLAFAETKRRRKLVFDRWPTSCYPIDERGQFGGEFSPSIAYAWFCFDHANPRNEFEILSRSR